MTRTLQNALAPYAVPADAAAERAHQEPELGSAEPREPFELDRHRIIGSTAFRRLEGKTQVFAPSHHDHFRTRLTHTLEVAQIARCLARRLRANESLAEAITLAHDLGHPPFGHAGEAALDEAMAGSGGFNHNAHSLRVVEYLEHPFPPFRGLNLTAETRLGLAAHETQYDCPSSAGSMSDDGATVMASGPSVEAQIASIADRIAYDCHDLEDGIGAGLVTLDELAGIDLWDISFNAATGSNPLKQGTGTSPRASLGTVSGKRLGAGPVLQRTGRGESESIFAVRRPVLDAILNGLLNDVIVTSGALLAPIQSPDQARSAGHSLVTLSAQSDRLLTELERFLATRLYRCEEIAAADDRGRRMVTDVVEAYRRTPANLPPRFYRRLDEQGIDRVVCDYVAGMTDRFCRTEHERLMSP